MCSLEMLVNHCSSWSYVRRDGVYSLCTVRLCKCLRLYLLNYSCPQGKEDIAPFSCLLQYINKHVDTELQVSESSHGAEIIAGKCTE